MSGITKNGANTSFPMTPLIRWRKPSMRRRWEKWPPRRRRSVCCNRPAVWRLLQRKSGRRCCTADPLWLRTNWLVSFNQTLLSERNTQWLLGGGGEQNNNNNNNNMTPLLQTFVKMLVSTRISFECEGNAKNLETYVENIPKYLFSTGAFWLRDKLPKIQN